MSRPKSSGTGIGPVRPIDGGAPGSGQEHPTLRAARVEEAAALSAFMTRMFTEAFGADNNPDDLAMYLRRSYSAARQRKELGDPDIRTIIAEGPAGLAGYAMLRRGSVPPPVVTQPDPVELWRFYVDTPWKGGGLAQRLMTAVRHETALLGGGSLWLSVWERNPRAIAFYRKEGFVDVGSQVFVVGTDPQNDRVMVAALGSIPPSGTADLS